MERLSYNFIILSSFAYSVTTFSILNSECQCHSLTNTHTHIHAYTNKLQGTGTCFSHQTGLFQVLYTPRLYETKAANLTSATAPRDMRASSVRHTYVFAQPISPHPPSARWAGTCTAAVGSEPASSALPPARAPSSASPPEPQ